jgi:hypothetical protein
VKRLLLLVVVALVVAWLAWGLALRRRGAAPGDAPPGELRGAWHVHTSASDGRAPLGDVVREARAAGLQFLVVTDHNLRVPDAPEWRDGVLVIPGTEISSPVGHVVAVGIPRALTDAERRGSPFDAVATLGGRAVVAHPLQPRRPFRGDWGDPRIAGVEPVSNDSFWGFTVAGRRVGAVAEAALAFPFAGAESVLALYAEPAEELALYDRVSRARPVAFLCSADAHGLPSYRAAFEAFSMHVRVTPSGDAGQDARRVVDALLDGRATCVFDAVAPGWGAGLRVDPGSVALVAPPRGAEVRILHDGALVRTERQPAGGTVSLCGGAAAPCARGAWRAEARLAGRPWIFTSTARIE